MGAVLTEEKLGRLFAEFEHTAFRLELQPFYVEPSERDAVRRFVAGRPEPPTEVPELRDWYDMIRSLVGQGKRVERVRVHNTPPTEYQRWERWIGKWNVAAGEHIRYMTTGRAVEVGLLPQVGKLDWWLFDSSRLVQLHFDKDGYRIKNELITDPTMVVRACAWRDLAVHFSVPDSQGTAAA